MKLFQGVIRGFLGLLLISAFLLCGPTNDSLADQGQIQARLVFDKTSFQPAKDNETPVGRVGVLLKIKPEWHTYWRNSGEAAIPIKIKWELPSGWTVGELQWPTPHRFQERGNITTYGYENEVLLSAPIFSSSIVPEKDAPVMVRAKVNWLVCNDICVPGSAQLEKEIPFSASLPEQISTDYAEFEKFQDSSPVPSLGEKTLGISISTRAVQNGEGLDLFFEIAGLKNLAAESVGKEIQIFPLSQSPLRPLPQAVGRVIEKDGKEVALVRFSYPKAKALSEMQGAAVEGLLAFGKNVSPLTKELALTWKQALSTVEPSSTTSAADPGFVPLEYRVLNHSGAAAESPQEVKTPANLGVPTPEPMASAGSRILPQKTDETGLFFALLFAFIGGIILNLMPCVLPIISIKIMGFVEAGNQTRKAALTSSLYFAAGIMASVLSLALTIISLRSLGYSMGWGFQFQHPSFVFGLTAIVFVLSLSFFDLYNIELPGLNKANKFAGALTSPQAKSFFDGVLATALSTPCTAPFLGTALVFAFSQPPWVTILIFVAIGLGLALPYVLLATSPRLTRLLPKPGTWMFRFRQFLGFLLLGTVLWLMFVLHALTNIGALWAALFLLVLFFALWIIRGFGDQKIKPGPIRLALALCLIGYSFAKCYPKVLLGDKASQQTENSIPWKDYSEAHLADAQAAGKTVFIDFTASWCITCKTNELVVIDTDETSAKIRDAGIVPLRADWTAGDETITTALKRYGAEGVPLYVVITPGQAQPTILSGIISKNSLYKAFEGKTE